MSEENHLNHKFTSHYDMMDHLHEAQNIYGLHPNDKASIYKYTGDSSVLNKSLLNGLYPADPDGSNVHHVDIHNTILERSTHTQESFHVYTGGPDFSELAKKSKDNILHLPAHLSTSLDPEQARKFGQGIVSKINIHPKDRSLAIGKISSLPKEHEVLLPAGTRLKYTHHDDDGRANFDIHSQVKVPTFNEPGAAIDDTIKKFSKSPSTTKLSSYMQNFLGDERLQNHFTKDRVHSLIRVLSHKENTSREADLSAISNYQSNKIDPKRLIDTALVSKNPAEAALALRHKPNSTPDDVVHQLHNHAEKDRSVYSDILPEKLTNHIDAARYEAHLLDEPTMSNRKVGEIVFRHAVSHNPDKAKDLISNPIVQRALSVLPGNHPIHSELAGLDTDTADHINKTMIESHHLDNINKNFYLKARGLENTDPKTNMGKYLADKVPHFIAKFSPKINEYLPSLFHGKNSLDVFENALTNPYVDHKQLIGNHSEHITDHAIDRMTSSVHHDAINDKTLHPRLRVKLMSHPDMTFSKLTANSVDTYLDHYDARTSDFGTEEILKNAGSLTDGQKTKLIDKTKKDYFLQSKIISRGSDLKETHLNQLAKAHPAHIEAILSKLGNIPDSFLDKHLSLPEAQGSPSLGRKHIDKLIESGAKLSTAFFYNKNVTNDHINHIIQHGNLSNRNILATHGRPLSDDQMNRMLNSGVSVDKFLQSDRVLTEKQIRMLHEKVKGNKKLEGPASYAFSRNQNTPADILHDNLTKPSHKGSHDYILGHPNLSNHSIQYAIDAGMKNVANSHHLDHSHISQIIQKFPEKNGSDENDSIVRDLVYTNNHKLGAGHITDILDKHPSKTRLVWDELRGKLNDSHLEKIITSSHYDSPRWNAVHSSRASHNLVNKLVMGHVKPHGGDTETSRLVAVQHRNFDEGHMDNLLADHQHTNADLIKCAINNHPMVLNKFHITAASSRKDSEELLSHMKNVREDLFDHNTEYAR